MIEAFEILSGADKIRGLTVLPHGSGRFPCAVLSHGLISSKESTKYVALSQKFADAGIATCRFDYHGCGESGGNIEETTLSIRYRNLCGIVEFIMDHRNLDPERIGIIGSSFGGTTGLIKAARDRRIKCVSLWATPCTLEKEGNGRIDNIQFKDDIYNDFLKYDILLEARSISRALVIHGEKDETVPCKEGKMIYDNLKEPKQLEIVANGDHVFSDISHREKVMQLALDWFQAYLVEG